MPDPIVRRKLAATNYIIGNESYVGTGKELHSRYATSLKADVKIIASPPREATTETISQMTSCVITMAQAQGTNELLMENARRINASVTHIAATVEELNTKQTMMTQEQSCATQSITEMITEVQ